eukprot:767137-Hanusia_phi.AAC.7
MQLPWGELSQQMPANLDAVRRERRARRKGEGCRGKERTEGNKWALLPGGGGGGGRRSVRRRREERREGAAEGETEARIMPANQVDKEGGKEREYRLKAALLRRNAAAAKAKFGDQIEVEHEVQPEEKRFSTLEMLARRKFVGIPIRMVQAQLERRRSEKRALEELEAR